MKFPAARCFFGRCSLEEGIMTSFSCIPKSSTSTCGKVLFVLLSPVWLCYLLLNIALGIVRDLIFMLLWVACCFGCCCRRCDEHQIGYETYQCCDGTDSKENKPVLYDAPTLCTGSWWSMLYEYAPDWCCNEGGCCSNV